MGKIEDQVRTRHDEYVSLLDWYVRSINKINADHINSVNDLNRAFNERMAEIKAMALPKKNVNRTNKSKKKSQGTVS